MRLPLFRATALLAIIAALATLSGFAPARVGPGSRDRVLRLARGGPQRLESPDGPIHSHEETDAVQVPAGQVIDTATLAKSPPGSHDEPIPSAALPFFAPLLPRSFPTRLRPEPRPILPLRGDLEVHAPDRAPPVA